MALTKHYSNGTVLDDLEGDISKDDFIARITSRVCNTQDVPSVSSEPPAASTTQTTPHSSTIPASPRQSVQPSEAPTQQDNARVQSLMAERSARLQKERKKQEEADKEARRAVAKARREKAKEEETTNASGTAPKARSDWLQEQRTRQQDAKMERERILKSIESDKAARREREVQRRLAAQADAAGGAESADPVQQAPRTSQRGPTGAAPTHCALQIRLFDGTSIRSRFTSDSTLSAAVRAYVAEQSDTTIPYNFRQMQTPLPSRTIDITEENESLLSLGLAPSATLVLVPVKGYTDAYMVSGGTGVINKGINMTYHLATGTYGVVTGLLGRLTGYGGDGASDGPYVAGTGDEQEPSNVAGRRMAQEANQPGPSGIKIRTLADQRRENEKTEFYNGNQVSDFRLRTLVAQDLHRTA